MKLSELANHVNNLEGLSSFLRNEITKRDILESEVHSEGDNLLKSGFLRDSKEVMAVTKRLREIHHEKIQLGNYRLSLRAVLNLDAQIPTRL